MKQKVDPKLPSGFRDYLPEEMIVRESMLDAIRNAFKTFGFLPLETSMIEREEVLTGGDPDFKKQIFSANIRGQKEKLALRFDLTVPLARVVAARRSELHHPFKRYEIGKTWRGERAQAGRFKEFLQCDADIVGSESTASDAEILALVYEVMRALDAPRFVIHVNSRKILNGLPAFAGFPESKMHNVLRAIDKLDKQGWTSVVKELEKPEGGKLSKPTIAKVKKILDSANARAPLAAIKELLADIPAAMEGVNEIESIGKHLEALGVPESTWVFDPSIARGLGYYTGVVFETLLLDLPEFGSMCSGGRYDGLVANFSNMSVPAVGMSVGLDRLFSALEKLKRIPSSGTRAETIVLNFDLETEHECETLATELRHAGIATDFYYGGEKTLKGQLAYAAKANYHVVLILGSEERKKSVVQVKDMHRHSQENIPLREVPKTVERLCAEGK